MSAAESALTSQGSDFAALIAIDWADQKHHWKLMEVATGKLEKGELVNRPEAIAGWAGDLNSRFQGRPVAVCLEQKRGAVVCQLSKYPFLVLYPAHPTMLARFREALYPSGSKGDPGDTALLLELLIHHRGHLRRLDPDTVETRQLQMLVENRRHLVEEKTRYSNRLTGQLKMYFPQILDWIDDIDSPLGCDFLERWPALEQVQRVKPNTLARFFQEHNCRSAARIQQRMDAIYQATPATVDSAILTAGKLETAALVRVLKALAASIAEVDAQIEQTMAVHPETPLFASLPGAGPALKPRLIAAFGTQRDRYASVSELQAYTGIAPVTKASGGSCVVQFRRACPRFLRQTFHEFAAHSIPRSAWARAYYDSQKDKGKGHHAAVRSLAFKWMRVLFACWKTGKPYDEATYRNSLTKHHSPLHRLLGPDTKVGWKEVCGLQKFSAEKA